jgi:class 3 adenylate cyclase/predicted ATPase
MRCASCGFENPAGAKFCIECGGAVMHSCRNCGCDNLPQAKFCANCGMALAGAGPPQPPKSRKRANPTSPKKARRPVPSPAHTKPRSASPEAERRQLTVMFCDLVGSTPLAEKLDPEELRQVILAYQQTCVEQIRRFDGYLAHYVGDGLLVYFGYPQAHEDDAPRALRAGLGIVQALPQLNRQVQHTVGAQTAVSLQVRIGIHTGLVVVGEMGSGDYRDPRAIVGETPNIAARLQGLALPNTVVISAATARLGQGLFEWQDLGPQRLKGISTPLTVYRVLRESEAQSRFDVALRTGLTPLIGREHEVGLFAERWARAQQGQGQVVVLTGEAGIGKSRLVQTFKEQVIAEGAARIEFRCSPYHQHSAYFPLIAHLQRLLQFTRDEAPQAQLAKLQQTLAAYRFPQADTLALFAALLSLPHPASAPPLSLSPQKQKRKMQEALVAWLVEEADRQGVYCAWEDVQWIDPSSLAVLTLFLDQVPTTRLLLVLTCRPDFVPPWRPRAHLTQLTLSRLGRPQVEAMVEKLTGGQALPAEVVQQIVAKTDGVPLFVEELTKTVLESGWLTRVDDRYELTGPLPSLVIPSTLQDSLMARLDWLAMVKEVAQLGATLGREFSYELIRAVAPAEEMVLRQALAKLVDAEVLYQRGLPPQAQYLFKHALIRDAAYQSLLKSTRQQYHRQIAQVLEARFPETVETQPELLAQHYTEAGLSAQALPYWQRAGERATQRSAYEEAISHLTRGLELLKTLRDTPERAEQELRLLIALGAPLVATKGYSAPEFQAAYTRARELCGQLGETPWLFPVVWGLWVFSFFRGELRTARQLSEQLLSLAQSTQDPAFLLEAYLALGSTLLRMGELPSARVHLEQGIALYNPQYHGSHAFLYGQDPKVVCVSELALALWLLGYPDQAMKSSQEAITLAHELAHPFSVAFALVTFAAMIRLCRDVEATKAQAERALTYVTEQEFPNWIMFATLLQGWALAEQGQGERGIAQIRQGLATYRAMGSELQRSYFLALLAEAYGKGGQVGDGLTTLAEALAVVDRTDEHFYEAELYWLKGELTLQQAGVRGPEAEVQKEAEACFHKAIEIARRQQAKSLELRAVMSLSRLWRQQGKKDEARQLLAEIYGWFTEGFDTKDLQEAKTLLDELSEGT